MVVGFNDNVFDRSDKILVHKQLNACKDVKNNLSA